MKQYKWRCTFRDAYQVCLLIWPFAHTKLPKIQQIIEHYSTEKLKANNVVDLDRIQSSQMEDKMLDKYIYNFLHWKIMENSWSGKNEMPGHGVNM